MKSLAIICFLVGLTPGLSRAAELQPETVRAWEEYTQDVDARMRARLAGGQPFLWADESVNRKRAVRRGEVVVAPLLNHNGLVNVPNGLIHHWIGAVFIPNTPIDRLLGVLRDYSRYPEIYKPVVAGSRLVACAGDSAEFSMIWRRKVLFVNAAIEARCKTHSFAAAPRRGYSIAHSAQTREIADYGQPGEHLLPPDTGSGFIWRLHTITRYEEQEGGVYFEIEALALTRDVPSSLQWLVSPIVKHLSANSLETMLRQTRDAVHSLPVEFGTAQLCSDKSGTSSERGDQPSNLSARSTAADDIPPVSPGLVIEPGPKVGDTR
jgi:hypothetical protein